MRRLFASTAAMLFALSLPAGADTAPDWIVVSVTAAADGATDLRVRITGTARVAGGDPALVGFGFADRTSSLVDVIPAGSGTVRITSTREAGGIDASVAPDPGGRELIVDSMLLYDVLQPFERVGLLVFVPGMRLDAVVIEEPVVTSGGVTSWSLTGDGSASIAAAGPDDDGLGAAAGPAAAGSSNVHMSEQLSGIVGGFVTTGFCVTCSGSWHSPDGRSGSFRSNEAGAAGLTSGTPSFVGAPGAWTWFWNGVGITRAGAVGTAPAVAAYAPVGDVWPLFRPLGV